MTDIYQIIFVDKGSHGTIMHVRNHNGCFWVLDDACGDYKNGEDIELWPQYKLEDGSFILSGLIVPPKRYFELKKQFKEVRDLLDKIEERLKECQKRKVSQ